MKLGMEKQMNRIILLLIGLSLGATGYAQQSPALKIALLKYSGGGDWYANPTALPNLARFCNDKLNTNFDADYANGWK